MSKSRIPHGRFSLFCVILLTTTLLVAAEPRNATQLRDMIDSFLESINAQLNHDTTTISPLHPDEPTLKARQEEIASARRAMKLIIIDLKSAYEELKEKIGPDMEGQIALEQKSKYYMDQLKEAADLAWPEDALNPQIPNSSWAKDRAPNDEAGLNGLDSSWSSSNESRESREKRPRGRDRKLPPRRSNRIERFKYESALRRHHHHKKRRGQRGRWFHEFKQGRWVMAHRHRRYPGGVKYWF